MASDACLTAAIRLLVADRYASDKPLSTGLESATRQCQPSKVDKTQPLASREDRSSSIPATSVALCD